MHSIFAYTACSIMNINKYMLTVISTLYVYVNIATRPHYCHYLETAEWDSHRKSSVQSRRGFETRPQGSRLLVLASR